MLRSFIMFLSVSSPQISGHCAVGVWLVVWEWVGNRQLNIFRQLLQLYIHTRFPINWRRMSSKKPDLTIEIEELGQQYNGKFKGYVDYPYPQLDDVKQTNHNQIHVSRVSHYSNHSNQSNASQRSAFLERAQQYLVQSRLSQNIKSLSKNKFKTLSNSRTSNRAYLEQQENPRIYPHKRQSLQKKEMSRSKSTNSMTAQKSRTKILQEIADKLKKVGKAHNFYQDEENKSNVSNSRINPRVHSQQNQQNSAKSRVQKIKQIKQQMSKNRGGKLQHLLKDIKKSNKQAYKVVYTIKKANATASPFEKSLQMRDKIHDEGRRAANLIHGTNLFQTQSQFNPSSQNPVYPQNTSDLRMLAEQLHKVRIELKQVKNKNDELLQMSQMRSSSEANLHRNQDSGSQSSRITREIEALQIDALSNGSGYRLKNSPIDQPVHSNPPSFAKIPNQHVSYYNASNTSNTSLNQNYVIVQQPDVIQACFACGCTCKSKRNMNR